MVKKASQDATERRVHVLPTELLERVRAFQMANNLPSEVEAVRRLLNEALQSRDTLDDIMKQVLLLYKQRKDFRAITREILSDHILVKKIDIADNGLIFVLRSGFAGKIDPAGAAYTGREDDQGWVNPTDKWPPPKEKPKAGGWDAGRPATDLDDDIPF